MSRLKLSSIVFAAGLITLASTSSAEVVSIEAEHPSATATRQILGDLSGILNGNMGNAQTFQALCDFVKTDIYGSSIAGQVLGEYANLDRDQAGVKKFRQMFTSIMVNKIFSKLNEARGATFKVFTNVRARNANTYEVPTTMTRKGQSLSATIVVYNSGGKWRMIDGKAYGYSGVAYLKKDIQKKLKGYFDKDPQNSLPVTEYVNDETSGGGFTSCN